MGPGGLLAVPPLSWGQMIILLHSSTVHSLHLSGVCGEKGEEGEKEQKMYQYPGGEKKGKQAEHKLTS